MTLLLFVVLTAAPAWNVKNADALGKRCTTEQDAKACTQLLALATPACEAGIGDACFRRAGLLRLSEVAGVKRDEAAGKVLTEKACKLGHQQACMLYVSDLIMQERIDEATAQLQASCAVGVGVACTEVSSTFRLKKEGALRDDLEGLAAQCANEPRLIDDACFELGRRRRAKGDLKGAIVALERACRHWSKDACRLLVNWYVFEDAGVPYDAARAKEFDGELTRIERAERNSFAPRDGGTR